MVNMNEVISRNIMDLIRTTGKKQIELANHLGVSKQVMSKMMSGARVINAVELHQIAEYFSVSMERLVEVPAQMEEINVVRAFMGKVESQEARDALEIADKIADMICFYARAKSNAQEMMQTWEA